jgi:UDP-glucose 4-epimerase
MRCLVTGGAGFIGSHIAEELLRRGNEVIVFDNLTVGNKGNIPKGCTFIKGDIRNKSELLMVMEGVKVVFHDAAFVSIRASFEKINDVIENNFLGTLNVLECMVEKNAKKIILASSMDVYGEPNRIPVDEEHPMKTKSPYGLSKIFGETLCQKFEREHAIKYSILRYFNTYGIRQTPSSYVGVITTFINQALKKEPLTIYGDGNQTRDYVWVKDIANANILAMESEMSETYNIGSGVEYSVNQIADMIIENIGGNKKYLEKPQGDIDRMKADISKADKILGYRPEGKLAENLPTLIQWWKNRS